MWDSGIEELGHLEIKILVVRLRFTVYDLNYFYDLPLTAYRAKRPELVCPELVEGSKGLLPNVSLFPCCNPHTLDIRSYHP
jgi:hypothetical protein